LHLLILCAEFGQTLNTKVIDIFNTFPKSIYSLIFVEYAESYDFCKSAVSMFQFSVIRSVLGSSLICLRGLIC
jgi:hypothetical protein